jgi:hypothetical protein
MRPDVFQLICVSSASVVRKLRGGNKKHRGDADLQQQELHPADSSPRRFIFPEILPAEDSPSRRLAYELKHWVDQESSIYRLSGAKVCHPLRLIINRIERGLWNVLSDCIRR